LVVVVVDLWVEIWNRAETLSSQRLVSALAVRSFVCNRQQRRAQKKIDRGRIDRSSTLKGKEKERPWKSIQQPPDGSND
jgi:hypothetical protein